MTLALRRLLAFALPLLALGACAPRAAPPPPARPGPPPPPRVVQGDLDASRLLGDLPARASRLGAGPYTMVASGEAVDGERLGAFVELPHDACVLTYARASSSVDDIDLAAFDDEGALVAVDEGRDPKPTLLLCPPEPPRVYVGARVASGEGLVAVAAQTVPRDRADEIGRAFGAHGVLGGGSRPADAWPGLDDHLRTHRRALGGTWEEFYRRALLLDSRLPTVVSFPIEADQCVDAVLVPGDEVALVEIEAVDDEGRVVARAREGGSDRTLTVCSPITFRGSLLVRPHVGSGLAAIVLAKTQASAARDFTLKPEAIWEPATIPLEAAKSERGDALVHAGYGPAMITKTGSLTLGRRASIPLDIGGPAGVCTRLDLVAGAPLALVVAQAWSDKGNLMSEGEGVWGTTLFACAPGKGQIDIEAHGRSGPFAFTSRAERWRDPAFGAHPLAASRMLARAAAGPTMIHEGVAVSVRGATLEEGKLLSWAETVPPWGCLQATVGAEGEGTGLELRAFDSVTGEELDRSHAERAVSVRACAPEKRVPDVRFELRVTSGKLDVVIGERVR
ncbi:MAG: hypothetical protein ACLQVI_11490 [Polyangiaceae bacterium]